MKSFRHIGLIGLFIALVICIALLPSCRRKTAISNQVVVTAIGIGGDDTELDVSVQAVQVLKTGSSLSEQSEKATAVYRTSGNSVAGSLQAFLNETGRSTYILHNQLIGISLELCRYTSVYQTLDYFVRNQEGRSLVNLAVCRGDPSQLLELESGNDAIPAEYLSQLLSEGNEWGLTVSSHLLDEERALGGTNDLVLPIFDVREEKAILDGTALFRDGYFAGELTKTQTTGYLFAADNLDKCLYTIDGVTFTVLSSGTTIRIGKVGDAYQFLFRINGRAKLSETGNRLLTDTEKQQLTGKLESQIRADTLSAVYSAVCCAKCDPLGLSRRVCKQFSDNGLSQKRIRDILPDCRYNAVVNITLAQSGFLQ